MQKQCDVCGKQVDVDDWGDGKCNHCGWTQNRDCLNFPKVANPPNFISLNKAKQRFAKGQDFLPSFNEFLSLIERGMEFSFVLDEKKYRISSDAIWQHGSDFFQDFSSINDVKNAKIDGKSLKSSWKSIKNLDYEC